MANKANDAMKSGMTFVFAFEEAIGKKKYILNILEYVYFSLRFFKNLAQTSGQRKAWKLLQTKYFMYAIFLYRFSFTCSVSTLILTS